MGPAELLLLRVSKSKKAHINFFKEGVSLEARAGITIDQLRDQACADRIELAQQFITQADKLLRLRPPMYRIATGRYYYGMYHAMRAVVYFKTSGDDYEQHSELPPKIPSDFPKAEEWRNSLKDARLRRNEADYDPYPALDNAFSTVALALRTQAHELLTQATTYLQSKGCAHL